jgi:hypothetical protein
MNQGKYLLKQFNKIWKNSKNKDIFNDIKCKICYDGEFFPCYGEISKNVNPSKTLYKDFEITNITINHIVGLYYCSNNKCTNHISKKNNFGNQG